MSYSTSLKQRLAIYDLDSELTPIALLTEMKNKQMDRAAPPKFAYIEGLLKRSENKAESPKQMIMQRALDALEEYLVAMTESQNNISAASQARTNSDSLHKASEIGSLQSLKTLVGLISSHDIATSENSVNETLLSFAQAQERELLDSFSVKNETESVMVAETTEPKAIQRFKEAQKKRQLTELIVQALSARPENPGPLNPQMLAIKSLEMMQELSPAYLEHFARYTDTLFQLELVTKKVNGQK